MSYPGDMSRHNPDVFLSSAFRGFGDVREKIHEIDMARIWTVEASGRTDLDQRTGASPFYIVDELIAQIRRSNLLICVLRDVYGSSVFGATESVSFLETEIYQAALFHNNIRFFLMESFNPDGKLKGLLELVNTLRPGIVPERAQSEPAVLDAIKRTLAETPRRRHPWAFSVKKLVGELAYRRGDPQPAIQFFDKVFRPVSEKPDRDHIRVLLDGLAGEKSIERRLTRTWIALRELCAAPYDALKFAEYLPLWNEALGVWSGAAAWYGLHGHLYAGRLAAVNSQISIRERMDWRAEPHDSVHYIQGTKGAIQGTKGARASEYYSMAKLLPSRSQRTHYLQLAEHDVEDALRSIQDEPSGYLTIRGHIRLMQGNVRKALADFEEVMRLKEAAGDTKGLGESLADVGLAQLRRGNRSLAVRLLREGVVRLEGDGNPTFAVRAKKRLAQALFLSGHPIQAIRELSAVHEAALENQIYDQITATTDMAYRIATVLRLSRR
jgi:tetratricopeptide (TPR) repeat protein